MANELIGTEVLRPEINKSQVFLATHNGEGLPLSNLEKSFISFSWGEKNIEDFGFIVVSGGDRYQRAMYAPFQENVTSSEVFDGQKYWGYHFNANSISFGLATDGVLESTLQEFRNWFKPGIARDLVLSEYFNRSISARVSDVPAYSLLPFEEKIIKKIGNKEYVTSTTLWKGEISLNFVMDEPFWKNNDSYFQGDLTKEQVKVIEEDGIPHVDMFDQVSCFLANNQYCNFDNNGSYISTADNITINSNESLYLYNCGTGISKPTIKFTLIPTWEQENNIDSYINFPKNSFTDPNNDCNIITIGNKEFKFTTPGFLTSYNQTIKILNSYSAGDSILDLKGELRDSINDSYIRAWAMGLTEINLASSEEIGICNEEGGLNSNFKEKFIAEFKKMFVNNQVFNCSINSETGVAEMEFPLKIMRPYKDVNEQLVIEYQQITIKENIGDMICSDYLIIDERTLPTLTEEGIMTITAANCLEITADCTLTNFQIIYNYMYM